jgi:hypothetical protein
MAQAFLREAFDHFKNKVATSGRFVIVENFDGITYTYGLLNPLDKFDTVIIYGHGSPGSISMGLGQVSIGPPMNFRADGYEARKNVREAFGLDKPSQGEKQDPRRIRDLTTNNKGVWRNAFHQIQPYVETTETGVFHLFLMGCSVAGKKDSIDTTLLRKAAKGLSTILELQVCVSAPTDVITANHLDDLLNRIKTIRPACATGNDVYLKDKPDPQPARKGRNALPKREDTGVKLLSCLYPPSDL